jgi:PTS system fructose-specific IIA component
LNFADLLDPQDIIETEMADKWEIIQFLVELMRDHAKFKDADFQEIKDAVFAREKSMSTGIGDSVAIPHCSSTSVTEPKVVMAVSRKGMNFEAIDNKPVNFVIMLVVPKNKFQMHISTLAEIAKLMNNQEFRAKLLACPDPKSMYQTIKDFYKAYKQ